MHCKTKPLRARITSQLQPKENRIDGSWALGVRTTRKLGNLPPTSPRVLLECWGVRGHHSLSTGGGYTCHAYLRSCSSASGDDPTGSHLPDPSPLKLGDKNSVVTVDGNTYWVSRVIANCHRKRRSVHSALWDSRNVARSVVVTWMTSECRALREWAVTGGNFLS